MQMTKHCEECLMDKQKMISPDECFLRDSQKMLDERQPDDSAPYLLYRFREIQEKYGMEDASYQDVKKQYNDLALSLVPVIRKELEKSDDPLRQALIVSRVGNYIDFGAMTSVDETTFLDLVSKAAFREEEKKTVDSFLRQCAEAKSFLLVMDNCGEIVLDRILLEQLRKTYPDLQLKALVRGGEVLNDATMEDARYAEIDQAAELLDSGIALAGTVYELLPDEAKKAIDEADVILAKGQGNYETMSQKGRHCFYSFLCKCDRFEDFFHVPRLTGMFVEELEDGSF